MIKRVVTVTLWFYVAWYAVAIVAVTIGLPEALGPVVGALVAAVVAVELRRRPAAKAHQTAQPEQAAQPST